MSRFVFTILILLWSLIGVAQSASGNSGQQAQMTKSTAASVGVYVYPKQNQSRTSKTTTSDSAMVGRSNRPGLTRQHLRRQRRIHKR
jgi:hypothetical protein